MIDCPKFIEMHKIFHGKFMPISEVQHVVEIQKSITNVNVVDVNVTTGSKATEEHVFKDREPRNAKNIVDWEKERLKKSMVETIQ